MSIAGPPAPETSAAACADSGSGCCSAACKALSTTALLPCLPLPRAADEEGQEEQLLGRGRGGGWPPAPAGSRASPHAARLPPHLPQRPTDLPISTIRAPPEDLYLSQPVTSPILASQQLASPPVAEASGGPEAAPAPPPAALGASPIVLTDIPLGPDAPEDSAVPLMAVTSACEAEAFSEGEAERQAVLLPEEFDQRAVHAHNVAARSAAAAGGLHYVGLGVAEAAVKAEAAAGVEPAGGEDSVGAGGEYTVSTIA